MSWRRRFSLLHSVAYMAFLSFLLAACGGAGEARDILFVRADATGRVQLYRQAGAAGEARALSTHPTGDVLDFAASPDGKRIVYAVRDGADGALRAVGPNGGGDQLLLTCPDAECSMPAWSPDSRRLVYERRDRSGATLGSPRLYWLDPATGETLPLIEGNATPGYGARFSPDGQWLSYVSPGDDGVVLYRVSDGEQRLLSSRVGRPAAFSPDSAQVVVSDIVLRGDVTAPEAVDGESPFQESSSVYLYRYELEEGLAGRQRQRLSPEAAVDDSAPAWSPDGEWIAFGRTPADVAAGRQLWQMRPDGSEAQPLTSDPGFFYGPPAWSPDGAYLLFQRFDLTDPGAMPEVMQLRLSDGAMTRIAPGGYLPAWLP